MNHYTGIGGSIVVYAAATMLLLISPHSYSQQAWTRVPSPDTSQTRNILNGIAGTSSSDVWTVGNFESSPAGNLRNLVMHWDGGGWSIYPNTDLSSTYNSLWDVSAVTENDVWAVGTYNDPGTSRSQLLHWNGSSWSHTALPAIQGGSFLFGIDAISANDIWAVGGQAGSPTRPAYTIHFNGSAWTEFPAASPGIFRNYFYAVDGIAANDVWAVGYYSNVIGDFHAMAQHWNGSSWTNSPLPTAITSPLGELLNVTMIASNNVWALGSTITGNLLMLHWDGSSWSVIPGTGSAGGAIVAGGTNLYSVGERIAEWNGSNWTVIDSLKQLSFPSLVSTVSFSNGDIWAAGRVVDSAFHTLVYRTADSIPRFVYGNSQTLTSLINSPPQPVNEMLKVQDADLSQVLIYDLVTAPSHGILSGLPDTVITSNGFAKPSGVSYTPAPGYLGSDQCVVKVSVGPLNAQLNLVVNVSAGPLPVLISDYTVSKTGSSATMHWNTVTEINTYEFIMERSGDGTRFSTLHRVAAKGKGSNYTLKDLLPLPGWNYYRLQEVDKDGNTVSFPVKSLKFERAELLPFLVHPNPVVGGMLNLFLNEAGGFDLSLHDLVGRQVMRNTISSPSPYIQQKLPGNISTGTYILTLSNDKKVFSEKIYIKQ